MCIRDRVAGGAHRLIRLADDVLRLGQQFGRRRLARVVGRGRGQRAVGDVVLQDFVDQVDVGQGGVGVLAGQRLSCLLYTSRCV